MVAQDLCLPSLATVGIFIAHARISCPRCTGTDELEANFMRSQELTMAKPVIAVIGGSGKQGGGVVDALLASGQFSVRVVSCDPRRGRLIVGTKSSRTDYTTIRNTFGK